MKSLLLNGTNVVLSADKTANVSILIENDTIGAIGFANEVFEADEVIDLSNTTLYAGFIDVHNHGAIGFDVNSANADDLREVAPFFGEKRHNGVASDACSRFV